MAGLRALLALRGKLFLRRHGTPFDALLLAGTLALATLSGRTLARALPGVSGPAAGPLALALLALVVLALALVAHRLLYRARELSLVLAQPVSARALVVARLVELSGANAIALALLGALVAGASERASLAGVALATLAAAPLLASAELVLAWGWRRTLARVPWAAKGLAIAGAWLVLGAVAAGLVLPGESHAAVAAIARPLEAPLLPGPAFVALVRALDLRALGALAAPAFVVGAVALALVPRGLGEAIDAAAVRPVGERGLAFRVAGMIAAPLPGPSRALVRRDLALLARGAFPRGVLVLVLLPLGLLVFREATLDKELAREGLLELAALFVEGTLATVAAFLFAVDFPRERSPRLLLERAQPLRGRQVLLARAFEAALPALAVALALGGIAAASPATAELARPIALSSALLGLACAHHGAAFGLRTEGRAAELVEAAGFPVVAGVLVVGGALALAASDAAVGFPVGALAYPFVYRGLGTKAARDWESAEVTRW